MRIDETEYTGDHLFWMMSRQSVPSGYTATTNMAKHGYARTFETVGPCQEERAGEGNGGNYRSDETSSL